MGREKANQEIRIAAQNSKVMLWEVADRIGINDSNFSRKLRHELPAPEKEKILMIIADLAAMKEA